MNMKATLLWLIVLILLVACGGGSETEPNTPDTDNNTSSSTTTETDDTEEPEEDNTSSSEEEMVEEEEMEETTDESENTDEATEEDAGEEAEAEGGFGARPMSGTDPDTGLVVNPETVSPGDTFLVRGEIISMNLTPTTAPEFLIQSPSGSKFRLRTQDLAETFYEDGDQLQPFQYQLGILAQATATLPADAGPSDIPISEDLTLVKGE